jgi:hypothetical protein
MVGQTTSPKLRRVWVNGQRIVADRVVCALCNNFASVRGNFHWIKRMYVCRFCGSSYPEATES